jgi:hypothetical protein
MSAKRVRKRSALEVVPIADVHLDPANVRRRDAETEGMLESSLREFGPFRSLAVDGNLVTRAGNGTLKAALAAGISEVLLVRPGPGQLVAVQREDLADDQLIRYGIADNRLTDRSEFERKDLAEVLRSLESEEVDLTALGYTGDQVNELCEQLGNEFVDKHQESDAPEFAPQLRYDLELDSVEQEERWLGFLRWLALRPEYEADTIAGRLDLFLVGRT